MISGTAVYMSVINCQSSFIIARRAMHIYPRAHPIDNILGASYLRLSLVVSVKYMMQALK